MCANDVLCAGAEPLAFLDYIACGKLDVPVAAQIVKGISEGCRESHCTLLGGETAEMPAVYEPGKYDLAGYCVGIVENDEILPKINDINVGDLIIGLPSSGIHSNGFSMVNKIMDMTNENFSNVAPFSIEKLSYVREFLTPTRIYVTDVLPLIRRGNIKALAHITGGGLIENIPRILPKNLGVEINGTSFKIPKVFGWIAAKGNVSESEMLRTFNCGIGMILIVPANDSDYEELIPKGAVEIGHVVNRLSLTEPQVVVHNFKEALDKIANRYRDDIDIEPITYKKSGVSIDSGDNLVNQIKPMATATNRDGVIGGLGGFGGLFRIKDAGYQSE